MTIIGEMSFEKLKEVRDKCNKVFEKYRIPFVRTAIQLPSSNEQIILEGSVVVKQHLIQNLHIEQGDVPAVYEKITNSTRFQETIGIIMRVDTLKLQQQIQQLLEEHQANMPNDVVESVKLMHKYIVQFQRRLQVILKTSFEECIDVKSVQEKSRELLSLAFKDGLITYVMPSLLSGLESHSMYYKWIAGYFNDFLEQYGIYSQLYLPNQEINYEVMVPEDKQVTNDSMLDGKISDVLLLPYFFNDERYEGKAIICEGKCLAWCLEN